MTALPESEPHCERCGLPAIGHDENGCKWTEADVIRQHLRESRKENGRLRASLAEARDTLTQNVTVSLEFAQEAIRTGNTVRANALLGEALGECNRLRAALHTAEDHET